MEDELGGGTPATPRMIFRPAVEQWLTKIADAHAIKEEEFGQYAAEAATFFDGPASTLWQKEMEHARSSGFLEDAAGYFPKFRMSVNRLFEAVALFGPALYHQNPSVLATPLLPPEIAPASLDLDERDEQQAAIYQEILRDVRRQYEQAATHASIRQAYLNWLQTESDKKNVGRDVIVETMIHGMSFFWTEMFQPPGTDFKHPRTVYVSEEDVVYDMDACSWDEVLWVARRRRMPLNMAEEYFQLQPGTLAGQYMSLESQGNTYGSNLERSSRVRDKRSWDIIEFWEVYSKNGFGDYLAGSKFGEPNIPRSEYDFRGFGRFCYIAVARGIPFPLNLPPETYEDPEQMFMRAQWPIPFWIDQTNGGGWPCTRLHFYKKPRTTLPTPMFKPVLPELRFVNWCMSFLADKVASSCQTIVGVLKDAATDIEKQLREDATKGTFRPFKLVTLNGSSGAQTVRDIVSFLDAPQFSRDIWTMIAEVTERIDKGTGLTELMYGLTSSQMRSAREADLRGDQVAIRPDDMASRVEDALSDVAAKEMTAIQWNFQPEFVEPVVGNVAALVWQQQLASQPFAHTVRSFNYRVEAGSARKPNKANRVAALRDFGQAFAPMFGSLMQMGVTGPFNAYVADYARALDLDPTPYLVELPPPPPPGASPEEMAAQQELQLESQQRQLELAFDAADHNQELQQAAETHDEEFTHLQRMNELAEAAARAKAAAAKAKPKPTTGAPRR